MREDKKSIPPTTKPEFPFSEFEELKRRAETLAESESSLRIEADRLKEVAEVARNQV